MSKIKRYIEEIATELGEEGTVTPKVIQVATKELQDQCIICTQRTPGEEMTDSVCDNCLISMAAYYEEDWY